MPKLYDLPLKVLWIWNCNEAQIAIDFLLKEDGKQYQVKGSGVDAFISENKLKICTTDNILNIYSQNSNRNVYIKDGSFLKKIWYYWKNESGEIRYNELLSQFVKYNNSLSTPLFQTDTHTHTDTDTDNIIDLKTKQIYSLVFEMEVILQLKKSFKGDVTQEEIESLIVSSCEGFSLDTITKVRDELNKKLEFYKFI